MHSLRSAKHYLATLICLALLSGCTTATFEDGDVYARSIVFTVSHEHDTDYVVLASGFHASDLSSDKPTGIKSVIWDILRLHKLEKRSQFTIDTLGVEAVVADIPLEQSIPDVVNALSADSRVESVQGVQSFNLMSYNDPYFALQNSASADLIEHIHEISTGKNVVVGIVDTGVDRLHPELADNIVYSKNFVADDPTPFDQDEHGTAVAGVIGSAANNDLGIVGVAPDVKLMVFKACQQEAGSRKTSCDSVSIIKALNDVLRVQPDVLNLSLAGPRDEIIEKLLRRASDNDIVLIGAVDERRGRQNSFPANMQEVIAVGTSIHDPEDFANMILAPGTDVLTTTPGATYGFKSGSSMATAYVSGIAALMKEKAPSLNGAEIFVGLKHSAQAGEGEKPVVDLCVAVNHVAKKPSGNCQSTERVARLRPQE